MGKRKMCEETSVKYKFNNETFTVEERKGHWILDDNEKSIVISNTAIVNLMLFLKRYIAADGTYQEHDAEKMMSDPLNSLLIEEKRYRGKTYRKFIISCEVIDVNKSEHTYDMIKLYYSKVDLEPTKLIAEIKRCKEENQGKKDHPTKVFVKATGGILCQLLEMMNIPNNEQPEPFIEPIKPAQPDPNPIQPDPNPDIEETLPFVSLDEIDPTFIDALTKTTDPVTNLDELEKADEVNPEPAAHNMGNIDSAYAQLLLEKIKVWAKEYCAKCKDAGSCTPHRIDCLFTDCLKFISHHVKAANQEIINNGIEQLVELLSEYSRCNVEILYANLSNNGLWTNANISYYLLNSITYMSNYVFM